jgi:hypothetical protein
MVCIPTSLSYAALEQKLSKITKAVLSLVVVGSHCQTKYVPVSFREKSDVVWR